MVGDKGAVIQVTQNRDPEGLDIRNESFWNFPTPTLSETVWLINRAEMRLVIDKQSTCGERLAVNFQ